MVNVAGRSRGCATCRKRKVKCDESLPECLRCLKMGVRCPGARTDAFYVHAVPGSSPSTPSNPLDSNPLEISPRNRDLVLPVRLPGPPPSRATAFDQLFVSHFVESFFGPVKPPPAPGIPSKIWLHELPLLLESPEPSLAKHAIRAASMLSYGSLAADVSIKMAAHKWYNKALQGLQRSLSRGVMSSTEREVCAVVMLIHYETWAGTSRKAWLQHVKGAAMLLEAGGPERCRSGFMHQIFSHLRFQAFVAAMAENDVPVFTSQGWLTVPFEIYPKLIFDQLIDVLFAVQECLLVADQLLKSMYGDADELVTKLSRLIEDTMLQLHQWWLGASHSSLNESYRNQPLKGPLLSYATVPAAALSSLYDAASIMILRLASLVSRSAAAYSPIVRQHAQSILSANHFVDANTGPNPDRGSTMMVLQLKIVSLWSPSSQQRDTAIGMLLGQKIQRGGLSDISAVSHEFFADVAAHIHRHYPTE